VELEGMQVIEPDESSTGPNVFSDSVNWKIHPHLAKLCRKAAVQSHGFSTFSEFPLKLGTILGVIRSGTIAVLFIFMGVSFHNSFKEKTKKRFQVLFTKNSQNGLKKVPSCKRKPPQTRPVRADWGHR
jgi:hypothetical protein